MFPLALAYLNTEKTGGVLSSIPSQGMFLRQHKGPKAGKNYKEACQRTCRIAPGHRHVTTDHLNDQAAAGHAIILLLVLSGNGGTEADG